MITRIVATVLSFAIAMLPLRAYVQDLPPAPPTTPPSAAFQLPDMGDFLPLHRGQPAQRDGLLVDQDVMLQITQSYDRLQHLLDATVQRDAETCSVQVAIEHAHTVASDERVSLRDGLWEAHQAELLASLAQAQQQAQHAGERQWYESDAMWFAIGVLVATVAFVAVSVR